MKQYIDLQCPRSCYSGRDGSRDIETVGSKPQLSGCKRHCLVRFMLGCWRFQADWED